MSIYHIVGNHKHWLIIYMICLFQVNKKTSVIKIRDVNNLAPVFTKQDYTATVVEVCLYAPFSIIFSKIIKNLS